VDFTLSVLKSVEEVENGIRFCINQMRRTVLIVFCNFSVPTFPLTKQLRNGRIGNPSTDQIRFATPKNNVIHVKFAELFCLQTKFKKKLRKTDTRCSTRI